MRFSPPSATVKRLNPETGRFEDVPRDPAGYLVSMSPNILPGSAAAEAGNLSPSAQTLRGLRYDPITELVAAHRHVMEEIRMMQEIRDGTLVKLREDGTAEKYSRTHYVELMQIASKIGAELLRYRYARVPEAADFLRHAPMVMKVVLTGTNEEFEIGSQPDIIEGDLERDGL